MRINGATGEDQHHGYTPDDANEDGSGDAKSIHAKSRMSRTTVDEATGKGADEEGRDCETPEAASGNEGYHDQGE